jgi:hypothetical protein
MIQIVALKASHLANLELQDAQSYFSGNLTSQEYAESLASEGQSFTAISGERVIACAGVTEIWENRAVAWSLISKDAGRHMLSIHRPIAGFLLASKYRRIEAWVDEGFEPGMRWLEILGFTLETPSPMRGFRPDGGSCFLFSRVK